MKTCRFWSTYVVFLSEINSLLAKRLLWNWSLYHVVHSGTHKYAHTHTNKRKSKTRARHTHTHSQTVCTQCNGGKKGELLAIGATNGETRQKTAEVFFERKLWVRKEIILITSPDLGCLYFCSIGDFLCSDAKFMRTRKRMKLNIYFVWGFIWVAFSCVRSQELGSYSHLCRVHVGQVRNMFWSDDWFSGMQLAAMSYTNHETDKKKSKWNKRHAVQGERNRKDVMTSNIERKKKPLDRCVICTISSKHCD